MAINPKPRNVKRMEVKADDAFVFRATTKPTPFENVSSLNSFEA